VKIGVVAIMIVLALSNRCVLTPRLETSAGALEALRVTSMTEGSPLFP